MALRLAHRDRGAARRGRIPFDRMAWLGGESRSLRHRLGHPRVPRSGRLIGRGGWLGFGRRPGSARGGCGPEDLLDRHRRAHSSTTGCRRSASGKRCDLGGTGGLVLGPAASTQGNDRFAAGRLGARNLDRATTRQRLGPPGRGGGWDAIRTREPSSRHCAGSSLARRATDRRESASVDVVRIDRGSRTPRLRRSGGAAGVHEVTLTAHERILRIDGEFGVAISTGTRVQP